MWGIWFGGYHLGSLGYSFILFRSVVIYLLGESPRVALSASLGLLFWRVALEDAA